ncbi:MAG: Nutrient germinant receptor inner membrane subunit A (GerKA/GerAA/GerBA) [Firmicutes bacterium]|nr:Nutrient germinant receptor inner membrane subunit A (GerKA/GerAA/GerBA) [Bacillota bacterium]MDI6705139.1 spore germination protein [Bacillota bacterium]
MDLLNKLFKPKKKDDTKEMPREKGFADLRKNLQFFKERLKDCDDVVYREFSVGSKSQYGFAIIYVDGMVDKFLINEEILKSLMLEVTRSRPSPGLFSDNIYSLTLKGAVTSGEVKEEEYLDKAMTSLLSGDTLLLVDGYRKVIVIGSKGWTNRGVQEPQTESVVRGPREGFSETLRINTSLLRRRLKDPNLKIKQLQMGKQSKTDIAVAYMDNIVNRGVLEEVNRRLEAIDIDGVMDSGYIEQMIEDNWFSPFPQVQNTERPDKVAAALLEGRVAIICDNTPFVLLVPATLNILFQASEDYYERWFVASAIRLLRYVSASVSYLFPAVYIAITSYHPGLIPTDLALYIAGTRSTVPFPAFIEALLMEATLELLREAGIRLPGPIGQTIGIVGGLVIGTAAVDAGLVSPIMVIIVSLTAIASFTISSYNIAIPFRLLRFMLMLLALILGLYGIMIGILITLVHLCSLKSFGVPYLSPLVGTPYYELKDSFIKAPRISMQKRPESLSGGNDVRLRDKRREGPGKGGKSENGKKR